MTRIDELAGRVVSYVKASIGRGRDPVTTVCESFEEVDLETGARRLAFSSEGLKVETLVVVTTCNRSESLLRMLEQLRASVTAVGSQANVGIVVLEDGAEDEYAEVRRHLCAHYPQASVWIRSRERLGKRGYFKTYQAAFSYVQRSSAQTVLFLQDDLSFRPDLFADANWLFAQIKHKDSTSPVLLNLFSSSDDEPEGRWVKFPRRQHPELPVRRTQWFDLNGYLVERAVLQLLQFRIVPISESRWEKDESLSSGVGRQLTKRLTRRADIFQCYPPLVFHGREPSVMNPEARRERTLDNYHLRDGGAPL